MGDRSFTLPAQWNEARPHVHPGRLPSGVSFPVIKAALPLGCSGPFGSPAGAAFPETTQPLARMPSMNGKDNA